jgi:hypothetical protein
MKIIISEMKFGGQSTDVLELVGETAPSPGDDITVSSGPGTFAKFRVICNEHVFDSDLHYVRVLAARL